LKKPKALKFLNLEELLSLEIWEIKGVDGNSYVIKLQKNGTLISFSTCDKNLHEELTQKLKKVCILHDFSGNYEILDHLGTGHFAQVFLSKNYKTSQNFAAKIIKKSAKDFKKQKVSLFF